MFQQIINYNYLQLIFENYFMQMVIDCNVILLVAVVKYFSE